MIHVTDNATGIVHLFDHDTPTVALVYCYAEHHNLLTRFRYERDKLIRELLAHIKLIGNILQLKQFSTVITKGAL